MPCTHATKSSSVLLIRYICRAAHGQIDHAKQQVGVQGTVQRGALCPGRSDSLSTRQQQHALFPPAPVHDVQWQTQTHAPPHRGFSLFFWLAIVLRSINLLCRKLHRTCSERAYLSSALPRNFPEPAPTPNTLSFVLGGSEGPHQATRSYLPGGTNFVAPCLALGRQQGRGGWRSTEKSTTAACD